MGALIWVIATLLAVVLILAARVAFGRWRSTRLRRRFGGEYERAVELTGSRRQADQYLSGIERRRNEPRIGDLSPSAKVWFDDAWQAVQTRFVDEPSQAVSDAERLVTALMRARGYPIADTGKSTRLPATGPAEVTGRYRSAREAHSGYLRSGHTDTENLRQAFVRYRELYARLVDGEATEGGAAPETAEEGTAGEAAEEAATSQGGGHVVDVTETEPTTRRRGASAPRK